MVSRSHAEPDLQHRSVINISSGPVKIVSHFFCSPLSDLEIYFYNYLSLVTFTPSNLLVPLKVLAPRSKQWDKF